MFERVDRDGGREGAVAKRQAASVGTDRPHEGGPGRDFEIRDDDLGLGKKRRQAALEAAADLEHEAGWTSVGRGEEIGDRAIALVLIER